MHGMQEVGGSIPPGSTNLRGTPSTVSLPRSGEGCAPKPVGRRRAGSGKLSIHGYVYLLQSIDHPKQTYVGLADDLRARDAAHNAGQASHTRKFKPWRLVTYVAFSDQSKAVAFERYMKTGSGRAFATKRLF